jgi:hypothetical protein
MNPKRGTQTQSQLSTAQIGRCGELLVQLRLLLCGVESAPMSTDSGIDLVAYSPKAAGPKTIQVKANLRAKPGGGKGRLALDWWVPEESPAEYITFVDLSTSRIWLLSLGELKTLAQQRSSGRLHFYMYIAPTNRPTKQGRLTQDTQFEEYLLENRARHVFGA